ncbi:MAG: hypothetical protein KC964_23120, partial [Candidatus Omnitrophica bacterium]|nr:hypothetical protein [Candidatus Omnitrophota bacterium]
PLVNNDVVEWPIFFTPDPNKPTIHNLSSDAQTSAATTTRLTQEVNGTFRLNYSYEAEETNTYLANVQTDTVIEDLTVIGETIEASSPPRGILGIDIMDQGGPQREIVRIDFDVISPLITANNVPSATIGDFNPFSPTPNSGFALYRDNPNGGTQGAFDDTDQFLPLVPSGSSAVQDPGGDGVLGTPDDPGIIHVSITFSPGVQVPDDDAGTNSGLDFFVAVRTSNRIS